MDEIAVQGVWRLEVQAETNLLQEATDPEKRADPTPQFADEEPAQHHPCPPETPRKEQGYIARRVLRSKDPQNNKAGKGNITKGSEDGDIRAMGEKSADYREGVKEVKPGRRIKEEEDA